MIRFLQRIGIDPLVAFAVVAIDAMLFAPDSGGVTWVISFIVGILLILPVAVMQRFSYHDQWSIALAKGFIIGILTAIPTPLPAIATGALGFAALIAALRPVDRPSEINAGKDK